MTKAITHRPLLQSGRRLKQPPSDAAERIEAYVSDGFSLLGVAKRLGTSPDVLRRWFEEYPELLMAFESGRENERHALHNLCYRKAMEGNVVAAFFLLKCKHGYREGDQSEGGNKVQINFQLPGAMSMDDFKTKVIENGKPNDRDEPVSAQRIVVARGG